MTDAKRGVRRASFIRKACINTFNRTYLRFTMIIIPLRAAKYNTRRTNFSMPEYKELVKTSIG